MSTANQQTLAESGTEGRPPILEKESYVQWVSRFLGFLDNKREVGTLMQNSIDNGPYKRKEIVDPTMLKRKYMKQLRIYLLKTKISTMQTSRLMQGTDLSRQERHSRLMNEFDQFAAEAGESLTSVYERFSTLINNMDRNKVKPKEIAINTNFSTNCNLIITQHYSTPTNNRLRTSSNTRNQAIIQDGRMDIQSKKVGYVGNGSRNARRTNKNQATNAGNGHYARDYPKPKVRDAKYFKEQMVLTIKDEAGVNLDTKENDFMLMNAYGDDQLEELNALVIMMARIQPTSNKTNAKPTYDTEVISEDAAPEMIIKFITQIQQNIPVQIQKVRSDNGSEFKNEKLKSHYENLGIMHQTSIARTPQQNGVTEQRNQTLVEAARMMLIFPKAPINL
ncbi:integrase, catalytic region, zinc finger, CCHC-type containing protein [Tanacetum coccineum]